MENREKLIKELSVFITDKILDISKNSNLPLLPKNNIHLERKLMELRESQYILEFQASLSHGYRIQFDVLPPEECVEGVEGVFVVRILNKDPTSGRFILCGEKRVYLFPAQVTEIIQEESLMLEERAPNYYKLIQEDQFNSWEGE